MNRLIHIWNQNRKAIIIGIGVIAFVIIIIQVFNQMAGEQIKERNNLISSIVKENLPTQSIITGEKVNSETTKSNISVLEEFVKYCNEKDISSAYNLLTDECKEVLFNTKQLFIDNYYNTIFKEKRLTKIENYKNSKDLNTYQVKFYTDSLSTGNASSSSYQDYITVDTNNNKININSLITSKKIEAYSEKSNIKINVLRQDIYVECEKYEITLENNTSKDIILDSKEEAKSMYITCNDNSTYKAVKNEISSILYDISMGSKIIYTVKYNKRYDPGTNTKSINFDDIVLDKQLYSKTPKEVERIKIEVAI